MTCKGFERKRSWPIRGNILVSAYTVAEEKHENFSDLSERETEKTFKAYNGLIRQLKAWKLSADLGNAQ
jgi:hypothetical protein